MDRDGGVNARVGEEREPLGGVAARREAHLARLPEVGIERGQKIVERQLRRFGIEKRGLRDREDIGHRRYPVVGGSVRLIDNSGNGGAHAGRFRDFGGLSARRPQLRPCVAAAGPWPG